MDSGQIVRPELVDHQDAVPDFQRLYVGHAEPHGQRINGSSMSRCPRHADTAEPRSGSIPPPLCRRIDCAHELRIVASLLEVPVDSGLDHCLKSDITEHRCGYLELKPRSVVNPEPGGPTRRVPTHWAPLPGTCRPCRRVPTHRTSPRTNCETMFPCFDPM
jgi:hypothetical protein